MPTSARYKLLSKRVQELRRHLLPIKFSPVGSYSSRQLDRARAFRLLAHAEIEAFIEDVAASVVLSAVREWKRTRLPSDTLLCLLACYHSGWTETGDRSGTPIVPASARVSYRDSAEEVVDIAMRQYTQRISDNNGVRTDGIKRILLPTGVRIPDLDPTWLVNLDNFGQRRGEIAHTSIGVQRIIDPKSEWDDVRGLLQGLKELDLKLLNLVP